MKVPFSFGLRFVFRWLAPGFLLAVVFFPLAYWLNTFLRLPINVEVYLTVATLVLGWLTMLLDMPIYMLYEGRRYWPGRLKRFGISLEQKRLERLRQEPRTNEKLIDEAKFPFSDERERRAEAPTRLGNLLAECEGYPYLKYGMDGVFYWYRLWFFLDKDTREAIDDVQSLADGALYLSFASLIGFLLCLTYALSQSLAGVAFYPLLSTRCYTIMAVVFLGAFYFVYRISLHAQDHYAELFKAAFDTFGARWDPDSVVARVGNLVGDHSLRRASRVRKNTIAWRFLRWDHYWAPGEPKSSEIKELLEAKKEH